MVGKNSIDCNVHMLWVGLGLGFLWNCDGRCESNMLEEEEKIQRGDYIRLDRYRTG